MSAAKDSRATDPVSTWTSLASLASTLVPTLYAVGISVPCAAVAEAAPPMMLATAFETNAANVSDYYVSEKLDGVRAWWDGTRLLTRNGNVIHAPAWFTEDWPAVALDGELWLGRGQFEMVVATVRDAEPDDSAWRRIRYHVFDLPQHGGRFADRVQALSKLLGEAASDSLVALEHVRLADNAALSALLESVRSAGGEGLMLHHREGLYHPGRSPFVRKLKPFFDAEAVVVGHEPGKGKYLGRLGALRVRRSDGLEFLIGTGFTDAERTQPPQVGSVVTYAYQGLTGRGVPRFARYLRPATGL